MTYVPDEAVQKFAVECERLAGVSVAEAIDRGPHIWMLGVPAPARDGLIAVATSETQTVYVRKQDVREVQTVGERYLIRVRRDASAFVREEQVIPLTPSSDCGCGGGDGTPKAIFKGSTGQTPTGPIILDCTPVCGWEIVCGAFTHPRTGSRFTICLPVYRCVNPCTDPGTPA